MAVIQYNLSVAILFSLCLLASLIQAKDVKYCDKKVDYDVKVSGVEILPYPIQRGKTTNFSIAASTDKPISGGKLEIAVAYFGWYIYSETDDLCKKTSCPVSIGDFVISHSQILPGFTPPGSYTLKMKLDDEHKRHLTCINFDFSIGLLSSEEAIDDI